MFVEGYCKKMSENAEDSRWQDAVDVASRGTRMPSNLW